MNRKGCCSFEREVDADTLFPVGSREFIQQ
jgi:hypothetical protein